LPKVKSVKKTQKSSTFITVIKSQIRTFFNVFIITSRLSVMGKIRCFLYRNKEGRY